MKKNTAAKAKMPPAKGYRFIGKIRLSYHGEMLTATW